MRRIRARGKCAVNKKNEQLLIFAALAPPAARRERKRTPARKRGEPLPPDFRGKNPRALARRSELPVS